MSGFGRESQTGKLFICKVGGHTGRLQRKRTVKGLVFFQTGLGGGVGHSEGESLGMGGERRLGRKGPPQFGDQWGSLTSKSVW